MRPSIQQTMMAVAAILSQRSTCAKRSVGAVITDPDGVIIGSGYNGVPPKAPHCIDSPCTDGRCRGLHAEINAIAHCLDIRQACYIYVTTAPCWHCTKALLSTPIYKIYYGSDATLDSVAVNLWREMGREIELLELGFTLDKN